MDETTIDYYRKIQNAYYANSKKEKNIFALKNYLTTHFTDTIDYEDSTSIDGTYQKLIVIKTRNVNEKKIIAYPDETFLVGGIVDCYNQKWLITEVETNNQVYTVGKMILCNLLLRWQNSTGKIIERWSVAENANKTAQGINVGKILTTPELNFLVTLPLDSETINLQRNNRFIADVAGITDKPDVFILTQRDVLSNKQTKGGTITINLKQDAFSNETDNLSLGIADYNAPTVVVKANASIEYSNEPVIKVGGSYKRFTAVFKNNSGVILTNVTPVWSWTSLSNQTDKFKTVVNGNYFDIKALFYPDLIGTKIKITLADSNNLYTAELLVEVGDL